MNWIENGLVKVEEHNFTKFPYFSNNCGVTEDNELPRNIRVSTTLSENHSSEFFVKNEIDNTPLLLAGEDKSNTKIQLNVIKPLPSTVIKDVLAKIESHSVHSSSSAIKDVVIKIEEPRKSIFQIQDSDEKDTQKGKASKDTDNNAHPSASISYQQACNICNKVFFSKRALQAHLKVHSGEKRFTCDVCKKSFTAKRSLKNHQNTVHAGLKPHSCRICKESFGHQKSLYDHMERGHVKCKYCSKNLAPRLLFQHFEKLHSDQLPFECNICDKKFCKNKSLQNHKYQAHSRQPLQLNCVICSKVCYSQYRLKTHMENYH